MPSLAGFFRKNKSSSRSNGDTPTNSIYSNGATDLNSAHSSSPTTEYVTADRSLPSSPNGGNIFQPSPMHEQASSVYPSLAASSNKLRLPFTRKKASAATSSTSIATTSRGSHFGSPPMPSYVARDSMSAASDGEAADLRRLRPPPSKSAIFAAYGDPHSALSTRSLPNERPPSIEATLSPLPPPVPPKKPGFFHWSKSTPSSPQTTLRKPKPTKDEVITPPSDASFNLKSFRHVRPPSPDASLPLPVPRPRGNSTTSESSQRISVAAFREAQARRSTADSPIPSPRAPSPLSPLFPTGPTGDANRLRPGPRPQQSLPTAVGQGSRQAAQNQRTSALAYTSDSDESSSSEDSDSDSPDRGGLTRRKHTITKRNNGSTPSAREPIKMRTTKSEAGHGSASYHTPPARREIVPAPRSQSSHILVSQFPGPGKEDESVDETIPRSQSSLGFNTGAARPRATVSASAISPSAAAKRASIIAAANAGLGSKPTHTRHSSIPPAIQSKNGGSSSSSSSDSEDDAPLATFLGPRRPGSAMSSVSNNVNGSRSNVNLAARSTSNLPKPLIDINELTRGRPPPNAHKDDGFTHGATLLGRTVTNSPTPVSPMLHNDNSPIPTSKSPPTHFVSPPASPTGERTTFISSQSSVQGSTRAAIRSISALTNPLRREKSPEPKRDILTERLTRVAQFKSGPGSAPTSNSTQIPLFSRTGEEPSKERAQKKPNSPSKATASPRSSGDVPVRSLRLSQPSPPDEDLASMLGAGISLISRNGESDSDSDESESEEDETDKEEAPTSIIPIPIKERAPPPAFSVTSRPQVPKNSTSAGVSGPPAIRQRSSTLASSNSSSSPLSAPASNRSPSPVKHTLDNSKPAKELVSAMKPANGQRQRSTTMLPQAPVSSMNSSAIPMPSKPFATARRDSPASSTGDSSSGRAPFTPKDGSEVGSTVGSGIDRRSEKSNGPKKDGWSGGVSGLPLNGTSGVNKHIKRRSVSFEEDLRDNAIVKERETRLDGEERRRERRRSEAKAAIELGNVINGRGPVVEDDDDDLPINQTLGGGRTSVVNPMMSMGGPMPMQMGFGGSPGMTPGFMGGWPQQPNPQLLSPAQFMPPPPDPNFMAAHQQAMMYAKHAYQMAVAQQAMAAAGDEWERGSTVGGFGGGSVYGGASPSVIGSPYAMGMGMGAMGMQPGNGWSTGSAIFPPSSRSMYGGGISGARSEYGGGGGSAPRWASSRSSYGENFGPPDRPTKVGANQGRRESGYFPPVPPIPQNTGNSAAKGSPRSRTTSQPASPPRAGGVRRAPPPSSWKAGV